ncbi:hypothetical protein V2O64_04180 [Verrucomicrobiaceae bacterium 227]
MNRKGALIPVTVFVLATVLGWAWSRDRPVGLGDDGGQGVSDAIRTKRASWQDVRRQLSGVRDSATADERIYATFRLVESLEVSDFARWTEEGWFDSREGFELTLFQRLLEERWQREDPEGFVQWCLLEGDRASKISSGTSGDAALPILRKWAVEDPERLKKVLEEHPNSAFEAELIDGLSKDHPLVALDLLKFISSSSLSADYRLQGGVINLAMNHPDLVEKSLQDLPVGLRDSAESAIVSQRLKADFDREIEKLFADPRGAKVFEEAGRYGGDSGGKLLSKLDQLPESWKTVLKNGGFYTQIRNSGEAWLNADLEAAGFTPAESSKVRFSAALGLVARDPLGLLEQMDEFDLQSNDRNELFKRTMFTFASNDLENARNFAASLSAEGDRVLAEEALERFEPQETGLEQE